MKRIVFYIALFCFSHSLWANDYLDTLKNDLMYLHQVSDSIDFVITDLEDNPVDIDSRLLRNWVTDHFGSENEWSDFLDRLVGNLNLLASDNQMAHSTTEDYVALIQKSLDLKNESPKEAPFKCHDRYTEDFIRCTATALLEGQESLARLIQFAVCNRIARNDFHRCLESNY